MKVILPTKIISFSLNLYSGESNRNYQKNWF